MKSLVRKKYKLTGKVADYTIHESEHYTLIGVYWNWFILASVPALNPLAPAKWSYIKK